MTGTRTMRAAFAPLTMAVLLSYAPVAWGQAAQAPEACAGAVAKLRTEWDALGLSPSAKPGGRVVGRGGHAHVQQELDFMAHHYNQAASLCREGKDHASLLHVDLVRAYLQLPENPHPAEPPAPGK